MSGRDAVWRTLVSLNDLRVKYGDLLEECSEAYWRWDIERKDSFDLGRQRLGAIMALEQENTALREQVAALQESVSYLTVKATQAPPPKWALRQARRWQDVGMTKDEAVRFAQKVMRWTHTYMIKAKSLKETEDAEVQEDPAVRADDCGVDGAG